ncbi:hypothetical protein DTO013E5_5740 [Penicillium roqueforti]|nr:hypothetical protein DTO012A1_5619 [Penicillium roqueforti]KAI2748847.1 hypothetical protein DTO013F2_6106 [Penicillium roqueforti]KAI3208867.1 hypothetical protein DTO013E5_5740 [Penicillium roqueforti]
MERIRDVHHLDYTPRPCDHFDLIGGTSTGGIIAIMLGRLGMTVDECIRAYRKVAERAFTRKAHAIIPARPRGAFSARALQEAIKQVVREFCTEKECVERRRNGLSITDCQHSDLPFREQTCTKTVVLAVTKVNIDAGPTLFRTYDKSTALDGCAIWEVARATSAASTLFKSIRLGRDNIEYIDAGFGYNNPCEQLIAEAKKVFPGRSDMQTLSIGTGIGDVVGIKNGRLSIIGALKRMTTSPNRVNTNMEDYHGDSGQYFRFNVQHGLGDISLSDWKQASRISAYTSIYLSEKSKDIEKYVKTYGARSQQNELNEPQFTKILIVDPVQKVDVVLGKLKAYHMIPFVANEDFTGREIVLSRLQERLFLQKTARKVALYGIGGIGKTQVALHFVYWVKNNMPQYSIFWIPAFSEASFEQACTGIVRDIGIQRIKQDENDMEMVRRYLSSKEAGPWLFIVDNADDYDILFGSDGVRGRLCKYFPASDTGVILLTTRFSRVAECFTSQRDTIQLLPMEANEAIALFEKLVANTLIHSRKMTEKLLEELSWLPLAIKQAASYIEFTNVSVSRYLDLMHGTDEDKETPASCHFHDDTRYPQLQNSIAQIWRISFEKIKRSDPIAADILQFMSCIAPKAIPRSLLPLYKSEAQTESAINTLCEYALVTRGTDGVTLEIHDIVQLATLWWIDQKGEALETTRKVTQRMVKTFSPRGQTNEHTRRAYVPHALELLRKTEGRDIHERYELILKVVSCLIDDGRVETAMELLKEKAKWDQTRHCEEHPSGLRPQTFLTGAYAADGQTEKAMKLSEYIAPAKERGMQEAHSEQVLPEWFGAQTSKLRKQQSSSDILARRNYLRQQRNQSAKRALTYESVSLNSKYLVDSSGDYAGERVTQACGYDRAETFRPRGIHLY